MVLGMFSIQFKTFAGFASKCFCQFSDNLLGKDFSGFDICIQESPFGVSRYACFIIVASDFCLWIVLAGRIASRFLTDFNKLLVKKGGKRGGNP
jgi:hypothetical protein